MRLVRNQREQVLERRPALLAIAVVALASAATLTGCSGGGSKNQYAGTVPGAYSLTVTATSGGLTQTQAIALTVTAAAK